MADKNTFIFVMLLLLTTKLLMNDFSSMLKVLDLFLW